MKDGELVCLHKFYLSFVVTDDGIQMVCPACRAVVREFRL